MNANTNALVDPSRWAATRVTWERAGLLDQGRAVDVAFLRGTSTLVSARVVPLDATPAALSRKDWLAAWELVAQAAQAHDEKTSDDLATTRERLGAALLADVDRAVAERLASQRRHARLAPSDPDPRLRAPRRGSADEQAFDALLLRILGTASARRIDAVTALRAAFSPYGIDLRTAEEWTARIRERDPQIPF